MSYLSGSKKLSRRTFLAAAGTMALGSTLLAACAPPPAGAPAATTGNQAAAPSAAKVEIRIHSVKKEDVSDWIQTGLDTNIDGFKDKNPNITVKLETIPGWTAEYVPKILSFAAAGTMGDLVWFPPRHRSHIAWGTQYNVVTDIKPLADAAGYDMKANFFQGALDVNTHEGKQYWLSYISEPIVPVIAYNKTKIKAMGVAEPTDDWTFDELAAWAQKITKDGVFGYHAGDRSYLAFSGAPFLRQWGVEQVDATGKKMIVLDKQEQFVKALQYDYDLTNTLKVSPSPSAGAINDPELFGGQKLLAVDIWPFRIQIYPATFKDFEIGFVLTPVVNKGEKRRSMLNEHVFGITTSSKHTAEAFKALTWICGKEMNVQALVQGHKGPIARADVWADERIYKTQPTYSKLRPIMESIESDFTVANFRGEEYDNTFQAVYDAMILGKMKPAEAANEIQKQCQAVLDKDPA